jgi:hypothetical protein
MGEWRCSSTIIDLSISSSWLASFTPLPLCPRGKSWKCPMCMCLGGPHSRSGHYGAEKIFTPVGNWTAAKRVTTPTELSKLLNCYIPYQINEDCSNDVTGIFAKFSKKHSASTFRTEEQSAWKKYHLYRMSQEERSIFWEITVSVILREKVYVQVSYTGRVAR